MAKIDAIAVEQNEIGVIDAAVVIVKPTSMVTKTVATQSAIISDISISAINLAMDGESSYFAHKYYVYTDSPIYLYGTNAYPDGRTSQDNSRVTTYLHRAWSPDNINFVFWRDSQVNMLPAATIPASNIANLTNKAILL